MFRLFEGGKGGVLVNMGTQEPGIRLFPESCCQPSPAFLTRSPEVGARCLAATIEGEIPFQSCRTKKGLLFVTAAYLMVTTSPVFSRLHTSPVAGNENRVPYFLVSPPIGFCVIATMCPMSCRIIQNFNFSQLKRLRSRCWLKRFNQSNNLSGSC